MEEILIKVELEEGDTLTKQEQLRLSLLKLVDEKKQLNEAYKKGVITQKEYVQELTRIENSQKRSQVELNKMTRAMTGQRNVVTDLINSNKKLAESIDGQNGITALFKKGAAAVGTFFAVDKIKQFIGSVVDITAEFQKFSAVLTNTLGSRSAAQEAFNSIRDFAAKTPFSVVELTESFVKLANQGFKPTQDELRKLGDLASSQGKSFNQLTEAIIDAQTGEFERLKEFGIRASKEGDKIKFTFKGVQTQTDFTSESIRKYILSLGDLSGVSGGMAAISGTLGGKISNLGDNLDAILSTIGDKSKGLIGGFLDLVNSGLGGLNDALNDNVGSLQSEQAELNVLVSSITDVNTSQEVRARLLTELNSKYPDFLKNLDIEKVTDEQITARMKDVNAQFLRKIALQEVEERFKESQKAVNDLIDEEIDLTTANVRLRDLAIKQKEKLYTVQDITAYNNNLIQQKQNEERVVAIQDEKLKLQKDQTDKLTAYNKALDIFNTTNNDYFKGQEKSATADKNAVLSKQELAKLEQEINDAIKVGIDLRKADFENREKDKELRDQEVQDAIEASIALSKASDDLAKKRKSDLDADVQSTIEASKIKVKSAEVSNKLILNSAKELSDQLNTLSLQGVAAQKAITLSQIAIDTASAIAGLTANAERNPAGAFTAGLANVLHFAAGIVRIFANIGAAKSIISGAAAGGGNFLTKGPTLLMVGDNPGGVERVTVEPLSGKGKTKVNPAGNLIQMAGGGTLTTGFGNFATNQAFAMAEQSLTSSQLASLLNTVKIVLPIESFELKQRTRDNIVQQAQVI